MLKRRSREENFNKFYEIMLELWPFAIFGDLLLSFALHKPRTMFANVLKFHICIPDENIGHPYF